MNASRAMNRETDSPTPSQTSLNRDEEIIPQPPSYADVQQQQQEVPSQPAQASQPAQPAQPPPSSSVPAAAQGSSTPKQVCIMTFM